MEYIKLSLLSLWRSFPGLLSGTNLGDMKARQDVQYAVLDISVGNRDLQQCADAVMRIRGEYLQKAGMTPSFLAVSGKYITYGPADGVWYQVREGVVNTPEWTFKSDQARTW
jgi:Domain of unknown function (4846)